MNLSSYPFSLTEATRYTFISKGKRDIQKVVEFLPGRPLKNFFNLAFGDLLPDDSIDDMANSNNGDIVKVLTTVVRILEDFTLKYPQANIFFAGSTEERTILYKRIIKRYYSTFKERFGINVIVMLNEQIKQIEFEQLGEMELVGFLIKKNS